MRVAKKISGRIFAFMLALVLVSGIMITGNTLSVLANEPETELEFEVETEAVHSTEVPSGYTAIKTPADFDKIRNNLSGKYILMSDIDLSSYATNGSTTSATWSTKHGWKPIGESESKGFKGVLDGNGYTISGLWSKDRGSNTGLFGWLTGATVKNLTIKLTAAGITGSGERKGGLAGDAYSKTVIDNVRVIGAGSGSPITGEANYIAGLVGVVKESTISNSSVTNVKLTGYSYVAGFAGVIYKNSTVSSSYVKNIDAYAKGSYAGGFAGAIYDKNPLVMLCSVFDSVVKSKGAVAGGFTAIAYDTAVLTMCYVDNIKVEAYSYAGGFAGQIHGSAKVSISCAQNGTAATTTSYIAGGFVGEFAYWGSISNCYAQIDVTSKTSGAGSFVGYYSNTGCGKFISNTYGAGKVTAGQKSNYGAYAGFTGACYSTYAGTNYYDKDLNPGLSASGTKYLGQGPTSSLPHGYTTTEMKKQANFKGWDFNKIWTIKENQTYPYFLFRAAGDYNPSVPPIVDDIYAGDRKITGEGIPGASITVTFPDGRTVETTVGNDGKWSVDVLNDINLKAGDIVNAVQKENGKDDSPPVTVIVLGEEDNQSEKPIVNEVNAGDKEITGEGIPGAEITVTFPGGSEGTTTVEDDGTWSVDVPPGVELEEGDTIVVVQQEEGKNPSEEVIVTIPIKEDSRAPHVDPVTEGDKKITGDGVPGAEITVTFPGGSEGKAIVDEYGNWSVDVPSGMELKKGDEISVVQQENGKKPSIPEIVIVEGKEISAKPVINNVYENSTKVTGLGIPGAKITVTFPGGLSMDTVVNLDYSWSVSIPGTVTLQAGKIITAYQTEPGKNDSELVSTTIRPDPASTKRYVYVTQSAPDDDTLYREGELVDVTVTAYNGNTEAWNNVTVMCVLPAGIEIMSVELGGLPSTDYSYNPTTGRLTISNLNLIGKESKDINITLTVAGSAIDTKFIATAVAF